MSRSYFSCSRVRIFKIRFPDERRDVRTSDCAEQNAAETLRRVEEGLQRSDRGVCRSSRQSRANAAEEGDSGIDIELKALTKNFKAIQTSVPSVWVSYFAIDLEELILVI